MEVGQRPWRMPGACVTEAASGSHGGSVCKAGAAQSPGFGVLFQVRGFVGLRERDSSAPPLPLRSWPFRPHPQRRGPRARGFDPGRGRPPRPALWPVCRYRARTPGGGRLDPKRGAVGPRGLQDGGIRARVPGVEGPAALVCVRPRALSGLAGVRCPRAHGRPGGLCG